MATAVGLVLDQDVDHAVGLLHVHRADVLRAEHAKPAALDHRRAAHADVGALGGDDHVAAAQHRGVAGEAAAGGDADQSARARRHPAPELEAAHAAAAAAFGVARPPAAALAEEHRRQPPALGQLDHAVHLVVVVGALGAGQHGVVVGHHRAAGGLLADQRRR